jgi:serine/threonine-protein kinase
VCNRKKLYAGAARLYAEGFTAHSKLPDDLKAAHRYNAACNAALAGCGHGKDVPQPDDKERARWRKQALDWLRADLASWTKLMESGKPEDGKAVQDALRHWQKVPDLAGIRDPDAVAKLPADERDACRRLWADVAALLAKAETAGRG